MRAAIYERFGEPSEVLIAGERPVPEPGPGEIRVRMTLSPIHNHDLWTIRGTYGYKPALPAIGGSEAVGVVDAHGAGVAGPAIGQRVVVAGVHGSWADYFIASAASAVPLPDGIDDDTACQLIAMPLSSLMLLEDLQITSGQWMIQNAANGAVGKIVAKLAQARGIKVVGLVRRDAGIAELSALGIDGTISTETPGWEDRVRALVGKAPILRAVDSVGGEEGGRLTSLLAEGGMLMSFGAMSNKPLVISSGDLIFRQISVKGFWGARRMASTDKAELGRLIGELVRLAASGELRLAVDERFALADAAAAAAASDRPGRSGKIAIQGSV
ncbi:zinc-binding dehydrogenase [Kaistia terrae]|uniref:enoyl-[acyl-carrier-protein] reductase n=1 Tax=Kaistia terrae TaxID=537017 RepID=A0ABW0PSH7_9HYPH|nr:zinc-binding dehydrogenase [Kaistia terrae]MCX5578259.1 zinc-binding dehydrogenase [Kaistia terrae]